MLQGSKSGSSEIGTGPGRTPPNTWARWRGNWAIASTRALEAPRAALADRLSAARAPGTVEDGADEDQPRGIRTDPEELEDSPRLGRGPLEPGKNLPYHAKDIRALEKVG